MAKLRKTCLRFYHKYGLRHVVSIIVLVSYLFLGGGLFLWLERDAQIESDHEKIVKQARLRQEFIKDLVAALNTTDFLLLVDIENDTAVFNQLVDVEVNKFQTKLLQDEGTRVEWDFWNSLLYASTLITTIGYGYLSPATVGGRIATMVYALAGIPLMLLILSDLGKLLTKFMKLPWFMLKVIGRRMFRCCLGINMEEIRKRDANDRENLEVFDLPIPIAVGIVVGWIFFCSAIQMVWEKNWDYLVAFYFFFISLSTIGLGDIAPEEPRFLLIMFGNIVIGLSLVSMCINLIYSKMEHTYTGQQNAKSTNSFGSDLDGETGMRNGRLEMPEESRVTTTDTLGIFQVSSSRPMRRMPMDISYYDNTHGVIGEKDFREQIKQEQAMDTIGSNWSFSVKL